MKYKDIVKHKRGYSKRGANQDNRANQAKRGRKSSRNVNNRQDITITIHTNGLNDEKNTTDVHTI